MPLIEVEPNILLHTDTGLRVVHKPGVVVEVYTFDGVLSAVFRATESDPAAVWAAIRAQAVPADADRPMRRGGVLRWIVDPDMPRRFRWPRADGSGGWHYGVLWPDGEVGCWTSDSLAVDVGLPDMPGLEWIDPEPGPAAEAHEPYVGEVS